MGVVLVDQEWREVPIFGICRELSYAVFSRTNLLSVHVYHPRLHPHHSPVLVISLITVFSSWIKLESPFYTSGYTSRRARTNY